MTRQKYNNMTYYQQVKAVEYLIDSTRYNKQAMAFIINYFEANLTPELLQELKDSLKL